MRGEGRVRRILESLALAKPAQARGGPRRAGAGCDGDELISLPGPKGDTARSPAPTASRTTASVDSTCKYDRSVSAIVLRQ